MLQFDLGAQERNSFGKGAAKSLRNAGKTPAILYGSKTEPVALSFDSRELTKTLLTLQRKNAVFNVDVDGDGSTSRRHVMLQEMQTHPVNNSLVHADFFEVSLDQPVVLEVEVKYVGIAKGVELGGQMTENLPTVTVKGLVLDIPNFFEVDVSDLLIGDNLTCSVLEVAGNVEVLNDKDEVCVNVHTAKRVIEEEEEVTEEAGEEGEGTEETAETEEAATE